MFNGKMRKLVLTAARNGYYFTLDRVTGEHLVTSKYGMSTNWAKGLNKFGGPQRDPGKGCRRSPARWSRRLRTAPSIGSRRPSLRTPACSTSPEGNAYSIFYLTDLDPRGSMGLGGKEEVGVGIGRQLPDRDRLQDRQGRLAASLLRQRRRRRIADHGGRAAVCGRWRGQPGGARCGHRKAAVAHAHRQHHECAADVHAGRPPVRDRRDRRYALVVHAVLTRDILFTVPNRRDFVDLAVRAAALPGAAEFFSAWAHAAEQHEHIGSSAAPPEPSYSRLPAEVFRRGRFRGAAGFTEILIPTDDTPGAREAHCAHYIDFVLQASDSVPDVQKQWRDAMAALQAPGFTPRTRKAGRRWWRRCRGPSATAPRRIRLIPPTG